MVIELRFSRDKALARLDPAVRALAGLDFTTPYYNRHAGTPNTA
jgi:hypothetical protein